MAKKSMVDGIYKNENQLFVDTMNFGNHKNRMLNNVASLPSEQRNVFSAMHLYMNTAAVEQDASINSLSAKPMSPSTCFSSPPHPSSVLKTIEGQAVSCNEIENTKLVNPLKRKQLIMDSGIPQKKLKCYDSHEDKTSLTHQQNSTTTGVQYSHSSSLETLGKSCFPSITNCGEGGEDENHTETNSLNSFTTNKNENWRNFSSDSERKTEYETGYDSMTEGTKPSQLNIFNMYDLFTDNPAPLSSTEDTSMSSNDDFPEFDNNFDDKPSSNTTSLTTKRNTCYNEKVYSFDNGICVSSDEEVENPECLNENLQDQMFGPNFSEEAVLGNEFNEKQQAGSDDLEIISTPETKNSPEKYSTPESTTLLLERLNEACHKIVLTPRHAKQKRIHLSDDEAAFLSEVSDYKSGPRKKITFTLNRILKDKRENEDLKSMEQSLLADVKKGGFSRFLNDSGDDDSDYVQDETCRHLERIMNTIEDCQGLEDQHRPVKLFSAKTIFCCYCPHKIISGEDILPYFLNGLNLRSQLVFIKENSNIIGKHLCCHGRFFYGKTVSVADKSNLLITWLLQILTTSDDAWKLELASSALSALFKNSNFQIDRTDGFHQALANLGMKAKYLTRFKHSEENISRCEKCRKIKCHLSSTFKRLPFVLKAFVQFISHRRCVIADAELRQLILVFVLLLSKKDRMSILKPFLSSFIVHALLTVHRWQETRFLIVQNVMSDVKDIHTLQHIVSLLPATSRRTVELRQSLALATLKRHVRGIEIEQCDLDGVETDNIEMIESLASELNVDTIRSVLENNDNSVTDLKVFNSLWFCVLLLQSYIGSEFVDKRCKESLKSVTKSLSSLNFTIRENGCLYCSAVKHHIRLVTAVAEIQLQEMSKSKLYQQGIFKYLLAPKVNEVLVNSENILEKKDSAFDNLEEEEESSLNEIENQSSDEVLVDRFQKQTSVIDSAASSDQSPSLSMHLSNPVPPQSVTTQQADTSRPCCRTTTETTEVVADLPSNVKLSTERNHSYDNDPSFQGDVRCLKSVHLPLTNVNKPIKPEVLTQVKVMRVGKPVLVTLNIGRTDTTKVPNVLGAKRLSPSLCIVKTK